MKAFKINNFNSINLEFFLLFQNNTTGSNLSSAHTSAPSTPAILAGTPQASAGASPQAGTPSEKESGDGLGISGINPGY